jgi:phosphoribosylanthranilate isomerase
LRKQDEYVRGAGKSQTLFYDAETVEGAFGLKNILVQIYEVQTPREAEALISEGVNQIGSVIVSRDRWKDGDLFNTVKTVQASGAKSSLIPLFSDVDDICRVIDFYRPDIIHFCEILRATVSFKSRIRSVLSMQQIIRKLYPEIAITRSIPIAMPGLADLKETLTLAQWFEPFSDFFLTDTLMLNAASSETGDQPVNGFVGITGKICDWDVAAALVSSVRIPVILAGGISPENACEGIIKTHAAAVDSCTNTNQLDGRGKPIRFRKDMVKVKNLLKAVRKAEEALQKNH